MMRLFALEIVSKFCFYYNANLSKLINFIPPEIIICGFLMISGEVEVI